MNAKRKIYKNQVIISLTTLYLCVLIIISFIACYFSYQYRKSDLMSQINTIMVQLSQEYSDTLDNFSQIYMPLFESDNNFYNLFSDYFTNTNSELSFAEKNVLSNAMHQMLLRDNDAQWIALYSGQRETNYIVYNTRSGLYVLDNHFPFLENLKTKQTQMEIYGLHTFYNGSSPIKTFALCGGIPTNMGQGSVVVGYSTGKLERLCKNNKTSLNSLEFFLNTKNELIFHSENMYDNKDILLPQAVSTQFYKNENGEKIYLSTNFCGSNSSFLSFQASWLDIFTYCHLFTPIYLSIVFIFAFLSIIIYNFTQKFLSKEIKIIQDGLDRIGKNQMDYRLPTNFKQNGFSEIAISINQMALDLNNYIKRSHEYESKQREAELAELQAKFNPHFLYNSLEMLRSRCLQSGDVSTANLITQLAAIFRGFIGSKTFIPIREELAFSKKYLSLFGARYGDQIQVRFDFDTEILKYGIIRNIFQPLIENYFLHGFETSLGTNNYIYFRGKSYDENTILLTVEDNGIGMPPEAIKALNQKIKAPLKDCIESYGLKNLHQRLQLFYGNDCGLEIVANKLQGISVKMKILKITCKEFEESHFGHSI